MARKSTIEEIKDLITDRRIFLFKCRFRKKNWDTIEDEFYFENISVVAKSENHAKTLVSCVYDTFEFELIGSAEKFVTENDVK